MVNDGGSIPAVSVLTEPLVQAPGIRWERTSAGRADMRVGPARPRGYRTCKPLIDRLIALLVLLLLAPLLLFVAVAIKIEDGGPVLVRRQRVGLAGELFWMPAFRSRALDADGAQLTRVGGLLRRSGLDELPQLINVLLGHLSIVGPRPLSPAEVEECGAAGRRDRPVRPGLTGLGQPAEPGQPFGRSEPSGREATELELRYAENCSAAVDVAICWKTAGAVLGVRDAC